MYNDIKLVCIISSTANPLAWHPWKYIWMPHKALKEKDMPFSSSRDHVSYILRYYSNRAEITSFFALALVQSNPSIDEGQSGRLLVRRSAPCVLFLSKCFRHDQSCSAIIRRYFQVLRIIKRDWLKVLLLSAESSQ